jgi:hypothetical protein
MKRIVALLALLLLSPALAQQPTGTRNFRVSKVTVPTTAGGIQVAPQSPTRWSIQIITQGTNPVFCGPDNTVTATGTTMGAPIANTAYSSITINTVSAVFCISTGSTQDVSVIETIN